MWIGRVFFFGLNFGANLKYFYREMAKSENILFLVWELTGVFPKPCKTKNIFVLLG